MRYLYTADSDELFAYAPGRRDFFRVSDDTLWAHESHEWLVAAASGELLAHRTGDVYYGVVDGERLYREERERLPEAPQASERRLRAMR
jgi:hypothetical protein